jgi:hypothetical protein
MKRMATRLNCETDYFSDLFLLTTPIDDVRTREPPTKPCQLTNVEERPRNAHTTLEDVQHVDADM